ncbi:hypothetical protein F5Y16DRAFT_422878 [Xylariaceae sp. FL0255]|nr:hypothetical protein F5Y16DRAFT_422878 [Xylariaceae sp. FL0255]
MAPQPNVDGLSCKIPSYTKEQLRHMLEQARKTPPNISEFLPNPNAPPVSFYIRDHAEAINFGSNSAEILAVHGGFRTALEEASASHLNRQGRAIIVTDSREAVEYYRSLVKTGKVINKQLSDHIFDILLEPLLKVVSLDVKVEVHWVPGHIGVTGNEKADKLAGIGSFFAAAVPLTAGHYSREAMFHFGQFIIDGSVSELQPMGGKEIPPERRFHSSHPSIELIFSLWIDENISVQLSFFESLKKQVRRAIEQGKAGYQITTANDCFPNVLDDDYQELQAILDGMRSRSHSDRAQAESEKEKLLKALHQAEQEIVEATTADVTMVGANTVGANTVGVKTRGQSRQARTRSKRRAKQRAETKARRKAAKKGTPLAVARGNESDHDSTWSDAEESQDETGGSITVEKPIIGGARTRAQKAAVEANKKAAMSTTTDGEFLEDSHELMELDLDGGTGKDGRRPGPIIRSMTTAAPPILNTANAPLTMPTSATSRHADAMETHEVDSDEVHGTKRKPQSADGKVDGAPTKKAKI